MAWVRGRGGAIWGRLRLALGASWALGAALVGLPAGGIEPGDGPLDRTVIDWWDEREGLPQSWVVSIAETSDGYLWLSTLEGVVRFDGVRFLPVQRPDPGHPVSNRMGPMLLRRDGTLWVASENAGLFRVEGTTLVPQPITRHLRLPGTLLEDREGSLWVVSEGTIHRLSPDGRVGTVDVGRDASAEGVGVLATTTDGTVWAATPRSLFRRVRERFEPIPPDVAPRGLPIALHVTRDDTLLVLTSDGLFRHEDGRFVLVGGPLPFRPLPGARLHDDRRGTLWVSAGREGLAWLRDGEWRLVPRRKGMAGTHVRALLEDREGSLWIGTEGRGLARLRDANFATLGTAEGLRDPFVWTHLRDREGTLWVGSQDGTLHSWADGRLQAFGPADGLPGGGVRSLAESAEGALLVGTLGHGIWVRKGSRFEPLQGAEPLGRAAVRTMRARPDGTLWIGTESGLHRLRGRELTSVEGAGLKRTVTSLHFDGRGRLWAGTTGEGLFWSGDDGATWKRLDEEDGLPDRSIRSFWEDPRGDLWVGTEGGGLAFVRDGRVAAVVSRRDGLFDNTISVLLDDGLGWLWMSCNRGVFRVRQEELVEFAEGRRPRVVSEVFDEADGLVSRECNGSSEPAGFRHPDGTLSFSTMGGVAFVNPARLLVASAAPPVVLESLRHDGTDVALGPRVSLPPGRGNLEVQFTAPTFLGPDRVAFRYRLVPFDEWSGPVSRRSAYYTNLPPGRFRFEVVAANRQGQWSTSPATVELELRPHPWQRKDLRLAALLLLVAAGAVAYRRRVGRLERQGRELAAQVADRTRALAEANAELARLAATDPGTGLANRRRLDSHLDEEWRRALRARSCMGILMIDVDHFKAFNDLYGHPRGDEVLAQVAGVLKETVRRAGDLAARYGGEEFAVVLAGSGADEVRVVGERVREGISGLRLPHAGSATADHVTVSVGGAACVPDASSTPADLVRRADAALYEAKRGRNRVVVPPEESAPAGAPPGASA